MIKTLSYFILLSFLFFTLSLKAQLDSTIKPHQDKPYLKGKHLTESPYEVNFKKEIPYYTTGFGLIGTSLILQSTTGKDPFTLEELNQLDINKINSFDREAVYNHSPTAARTSDIIQYGGLLMPLLFLSSHNTKNDFLPILIMSTEVFTITSGLALNSKFIFNRTRPLAYNPDFTFEQRTDKTTRLSFFSGHTATSASFSFFMAKVISDYHPNLRTVYKIGLWSFAIALPGVTGYLRIQSGKHFYTDIIAGFAVGATVGWLVPHLHKKKDKGSNLSIAPFNYDGATGVTLTLKLD